MGGDGQSSAGLACNCQELDGFGHLGVLALSELTGLWLLLPLEFLDQLLGID